MYLYTEILELSPKLKRFFWHTLYQYLARFQNPEWKFMNYGYADYKNIYLLPEDEDDRYFIQLYDRVVAGIPIENKVILEVGSGRGGGLDYINKYFKPSLALGIDLSPKAVEFSKNNYRGGGIYFEQGDALNIKSPSESIDVVINIESSHCYPSLTKFFQEVYRVLKPNGYFLYADLCKSSNIGKIEEELKLGGFFEIVEHENIVDGVLQALELDNARKLAMIKAKVPWFIRWPFKLFAGMVGSRTYKSFKNGARGYNRYVLKKI